jgi:mutual gliding-motility protein MglA
MDESVPPVGAAAGSARDKHRKGCNAQEGRRAMQDGYDDPLDITSQDSVPSSARQDRGGSTLPDSGRVRLEGSKDPAEDPDEAAGPEPASFGTSITVSGMQAGELTRGRRRDLDSGPLSLDTLKIVYWGPGRSGKTTNLRWLHSRLRPELRGRLIDIDTPGDRTLYFDCLPLSIGSSDEHPVQLRIYTVPGQPRFRLTRKLVLDGVDGIVFVWDSRSRRLNANLMSLIEMRETLAELDVPWSRIPRIIQYNKCDLPDRIPPEELDHVLSRMGERVPRVVSVATRGLGVLETLGAVTSAAIRTQKNGTNSEFLSAATGL